MESLQKFHRYSETTQAPQIVNLAGNPFSPYKYKKMTLFKNWLENLLTLNLLAPLLAIFGMKFLYNHKQSCLQREKASLKRWNRITPFLRGDSNQLQMEVFTIQYTQYLTIVTVLIHPNPIPSLLWCGGDHTQQGSSWLGRPCGCRNQTCIVPARQGFALSCFLSNTPQIFNVYTSGPKLNINSSFLNYLKNVIPSQQNFWQIASSVLPNHLPMPLLLFFLFLPSSFTNITHPSR